MVILKKLELKEVSEDLYLDLESLIIECKKNNPDLSFFEKRLCKCITKASFIVNEVKKGGNNND